MTTAWGGILPKGRSGGDSFCYLLAAMSGVLAANMLLGFMSPRRPWRWVLVIGVFVPVVEWLAYFYLTQKPERAQIYESFLAFLPGIAGAFGGAMGRGVVDNLFAKK